MSNDRPISLYLTVCSEGIMTIWLQAQQVIRAEGKSVVFGGRGKHFKMTLNTYDLLLNAYALPVMGDAVQEGC